MKKLNIIVFFDDTEMEKYSDLVCEKLSGLSPNQEFCGIWGEIQFSKEECLKAISAIVNNFINNVDKTEIYFGCSAKNYNDIISLMDTDNCKINILSCYDF